MTLSEKKHQNNNSSNLKKPIKSSNLKKKKHQSQKHPFFGVSDFSFPAVETGFPRFHGLSKVWTLLASKACRYATMVGKAPATWGGWLGRVRIGKLLNYRDLYRDYGIIIGIIWDITNYPVILGWWFQIFFMFTSKIGEVIQFDLRIFFKWVETTT